jgi:hypothetical protein
MGLRPTHGDESALLRFIDSKQVTRDFRRSVMAMLSQGIRQAYVPRVAVTPSHYSCAMNPPRCAI